MIQNWTQGTIAMSFVLVSNDIISKGGLGFAHTLSSTTSSHNPAMFLHVIGQFRDLWYVWQHHQVCLRPCLVWWRAQGCVPTPPIVSSHINSRIWTGLTSSWSCPPIRVTNLHNVEKSLIKLSQTLVTSCQLQVGIEWWLWDSTSRLDDQSTFKLIRSVWSLTR